MQLPQPRSNANHDGSSSHNLDSTTRRRTKTTATHHDDRILSKDKYNTSNHTIVIMKFVSSSSSFNTLLISFLAIGIVFGDNNVEQESSIAASETSSFTDVELDLLLAANAAASINDHDDQHHRSLQCDSVAAWHPNYSLGWSQGKCELTTTCNSPSYSTNLACCQAAYGGQVSNYCISQLANPPTAAPTPTSAPTKIGEGTYYPDYTLPWTTGKCINSTPIPSGVPTYSSMLLCCKGAYGGQVSGSCIAALPNPPTTAPTNTAAPTPTAAPTKAGEGTYYPDYTLAWPAGKCIATLPVPSGRPTYSTMLACCKGAYGGQTSGVCIAALPSPPTTAPTNTAAPTPTAAPTKPGEGTYYPDYTLAWPSGKCIATLPVPSGRPTYSSMLACCKAAYGGQTSGACIAALPSPPTTAPTNTAAPTPTAAPTKPGEGTYYPDYSLAWPSGKCIATLPVPSGRPTYSSMLACCKAAYGGQTSGACIAALPSPPTTAPTNTAAPTPTAAPTKAGEGTYYPDYSLAWASGKCINTLPVPSGRPTYTTMLACCKGAYGGQTSNFCISSLPNPPTAAPTPTPAPTNTVWYPDYSLAWTAGKCITTLPVPSGRPTYASKAACCSAAYAGQSSGTCLV
jgi:hypothetical protein